MSWSDIPGFSGFLPLYDEAVQHFGDGATFVEVGVALGHSIAYLARRVIDAGHTRTQIFAVDPWGGYARNGEQQQALGDAPGGDFGLFCQQMMAHAPEELERLTILRLRSVPAADCFAMLPGHGAHMALIDGAHDYGSVRADINAWAPRVQAGGWLCGDDHEPTYPGVQEACEEAFGVGRYEVRGTAWRKRL